MLNNTSEGKNISGRDTSGTFSFSVSWRPIFSNVFKMLTLAVMLFLLLKLLSFWRIESIETFWKFENLCSFFFSCDLIWWMILAYFRKIKLDLVLGTLLSDYIWTDNYSFTISSRLSVKRLEWLTGKSLKSMK